MVTADEGMSRADIRAALHALQGGRCAVCGEGGALCVDHDHATGLARGLLCRSCNGREGMGVADADIEAYLARPPAAGRRWLWALPDAWTQEDTAAARKLSGIKASSGLPVWAILRYLPQYLEAVPAREAALQREVIALGRSGGWTDAPEAARRRRAQDRWALDMLREWRASNGRRPVFATEPGGAGRLVALASHILTDHCERTGEDPAEVLARLEAAI